MFSKVLNLTAYQELRPKSIVGTKLEPSNQGKNLSNLELVSNKKKLKIEKCCKF